MSNIFYIADTHFDHANIIKLDHRPWGNVEDMNQALIDNWNSVVKPGDIVYILGDFCWSRNEERLVEILTQLNGNKQLIVGNHDSKHMTAKVKKQFQDIKEYKEIVDNGREVMMCHYPIIMYKKDYRPNEFMLFGHVHVTEENDMIEGIRKYIQENDKRTQGKNLCQFYNVGCMMPWMYYTPKTLDQIIEGYKNYEQ